MSDITGTIFPMYDKTGNYRRFPETVIEAVLGLPSYLQTQFSSLANIYMPIEGIHEAKTGQEFVYRATPNTIKANLLNLDKIYGKSLGWNQLVANGNFADGTTGWSANYGTLSSSDGILTKTVTGGVSYGHNLITTSISSVAGHKYLLLFSVKHTHGSNLFFRGFYGVNSDTDELVEPNVWKRCCLFINPIGTDISSSIQIFSLAQNEEYTEYYKDIQCTDLTILFNGSVPENYTVADFERDFPELYYPSDSGRLINNDAESMECVGRNVWDEEWIAGWMEENGDMSGGARVATKNYVPVIAGQSYFVNVNIYYAIYDANKTVIGTRAYANLAPITIPDGGCYLRFMTDSDYGAPYNYNICINLSDPSFNGQYEPFWKKDLHLGLGNFKVKSPNIWDEEWEIGYWDGNTEAKGAANNMKCKYHIPVQPNTTYFITAPYGFWVGGYDKDKQYIDSLINWANDSASFTTQANCYYITFYVYQVGLTTYQNNICINKSDPAFNGRYFSHEDITITGGLKGNGDWADMIVGNKYVKRVGSVDLGSLTWSYSSSYTSFFVDLLNLPTDFNKARGNSKVINSKYETLANSIADPRTLDKVMQAYSLYLTQYLLTCDSAYSDAATFKAAMNGVMLDYELQYPETYELVTPIATSLRAGTTEARISPNSYGLSAPMVCDITYSVVQDASSAADAQYAVTAGKLLNTRKIWGQDFNGEGDVTGAMSGATTIAASGNITTAAQLVSTVAQGTAPLSVVSKTPVTNLCAEFASKLETTRTIWGRDFNGSANVSGALTGVTTINMSDALTLAGSTDATRRLYFGDSNHYLELKDIGTPGTPNLVFHFSDGVYSDDFVTAGGINSGDTPIVIAPVVYEVDNWAGTVGKTDSTAWSQIAAKYGQGYNVQIDNTDGALYSVIGDDGDGTLYLSGGCTLIVDTE